MTGRQDLALECRSDGLPVPPWPRPIRDDTLASSACLGEVAVGGVPLFIASELIESSVEDCPTQDLAGLQYAWLNTSTLCNNKAEYANVFRFYAPMI